MSNQDAARVAELRLVERYCSSDSIAPVRGPECVLMVGDCGAVRSVVEGGTGGRMTSVMFAPTASDAEAMAGRRHPDLIVAEFAKGIELCRAWRNSPELMSVPVVLITETVDIDQKVQALDEGALDCLPKTVAAEELRARMRSLLRNKRRHDALAAQAQLDGLTGLWNRASFDKRLQDEIAFASRQGRPVSLVMLDIDDFKQINDANGHRFGDMVLRTVADTVRNSLRQGEVACRYGGEEFAVIVREGDVGHATTLAERLRRAVAALRLPGVVRVTASFGVADLAHSVVGTAGMLTDAADRALYVAKRSGKNRVCSAGNVTETTRLTAIG